MFGPRLREQVSVLGSADVGAPDQQHAVSQLAADHLEEVSGAVRSDEHELGWLVVGVDLDQCHVDRMRDVLDAVAVSQR
jgi:hypothetical protein